MLIISIINIKRLSLHKMKKKMSKFNKSTSEHRASIMGLSMLSIMLFHQYFTSTIPFNLFHNFGYWGVDVFLFLSGMGLVNSLNNNSIKVYFSRRFNRLIPSCFLCGSLKYIAFLLLGSSVAVLKDGLNIGILSLLSLDLWFIPTIIILYVLSPILFILLKKRPFIIVSLILCIFFANGIFIRPEVGFEWLSPIGIMSWTTERLPVFCAGMFIAMKGEWIEDKIRYSVPFLFIAVGFVLIEKAGITFQGIQACQYLSLTIGMPALITTCTTCLDKIPNKLLTPIKFFGIYSLELYLVHEFIFWSLRVNNNGNSPFLMLILALMLSCFTAYACKWLIEKAKHVLQYI